MRRIPSSNRLAADVEGDIEEVGGVLRITKVRLHFRIPAPPGSREAVERALGSFAEKCPAYVSVKGCIDCSFTAEIAESAES